MRRASARLISAGSGAAGPGSSSIPSNASTASFRTSEQELQPDAWSRRLCASSPCVIPAASANQDSRGGHDIRMTLSLAGTTAPVSDLGGAPDFEALLDR